MSTIKTSSINDIDFSGLKDSNVFNTFAQYTGYSNPLISAIAGQFNTVTSVTLEVDGTVWNQTHSGNASNGTLTFTSGSKFIEYTGTNILNSSGTEGVYKSVKYTLPSLIGDPNSQLLTVNFEGALNHTTSGNIASGTINKITYILGDLTFVLEGNITKTAQLAVEPFFDTFSGTVTGFSFKDTGNTPGELTVTDILPSAGVSAFTLALFDTLTFNQLDDAGKIQTPNTTVTTFQTLFDTLQTSYTGGITTVIVDETSDGVVDNTITLTTENNTNLTGSTDLNVIGNDLANVINGNTGNNILEGRGGNDTLNGLAGNDTLKGEDGIDKLTGGEGNDTLDGGSGKDTLTGGLGDDRFVLDVTVAGKYEDKIVESKNQGSDTLAYRNTGLTAQAKAVTLKLVKYFENLDVSQTGSRNFNLTGDASNNVLTGNAGNNVLDGGKGVDTLVGGGGADTYILDNAGDVITEALDADIDAINVKFSAGGTYTLVDNIEHGVIGHSKAFTLNGNSLDNYLKGNGTTNALNGGDGNDTLDAGKGNDTLNGGAGIDSLIGGSGNDTLNGDAGDDSLNGGTGKDILNGGIGNDTLVGGTDKDSLTGGIGNDTLVGGTGKDTFVWHLADIGTAGAPSVDTITDFKMKDKEILDLRDLLPNANEADLVGLLTYLDVTTDGTNTEIRISSTGGFTNGDYSAGVEDAHITLTNVNLLATTDESTLLQTLMTKNQLLID